jgi:hypothetical protein
MIFDEISFHDSLILEVKERTSDQTVDFLLEFPVDWENNIFEKKILRFKDVIFYLKKEIPFNGEPSIMDIKKYTSSKHTYKSFSGLIETSKYKIEMVTNAGSRFIEFSESQLLSIQTDLYISAHAIFQNL